MPPESISTNQRRNRSGPGALTRQMARTKLTVLISGEGTNLSAIVSACAAGTIPDAEVIQVVSNRKAAGGLKRAERAGIPTAYHNLLQYKKAHPGLEESRAREGYDAELARLVLASGPDLIVCAGFMHILTSSFLKPVDTAGVAIINLHPALYGQFDGANAIERAHAAFERGELEGGKTGVMIHRVIEEVDRGEPLVVKEITIKQGESLDDFKERVHTIEHVAIVEGTNKAIEALTKP